MVRKILYVLLAALVVIQFIHPKKNKSEGPQPNALSARYPIPADVQAVLTSACLDCHSNNTRYPWYATLQPVHWWLEKHIKDGKKHVNYDEFTNRPLRYQYHKMEETIEMVKEGEMPLKSYTWTHQDARLTQDQKVLLTGWAQSVMDTMKARYPLDSLVRKGK